MISVNQKLKLVFLALGVFVCECAFGLIQERLFSKKYENGTKSEHFKFSVTFVAIQSVFYSSFALGLSKFGKSEWNKESNNKKHFLVISMFHVAAMVTSNMSLQWISYPTQVVTKTAKPISVIVLSAIIAKKSYSLQRYIFVFMIVGAVAMFILESKKGDQSKIKSDSQIGLYLVISSLVFNGFTGATQERLRSKSKPSTLEFMYYINYWSFLILMCIMAFTGEGRDFIRFAIDFPEMITHVALGIFVGTFAQFFLNTILANFGSLPLSLVTTTRKFLNVLLSVLTFNNPLTIIQWSSTAVVFAALILDVFFGKKSTSKSDSGAENIDHISATSISKSQSESEKKEVA